MLILGHPLYIERVNHNSNGGLKINARFELNIKDSFFRVVNNLKIQIMR